MPHALTTTPHADGYHMPAEYAPHTGCWMLWPQRPDTWRDGAKPAQAAYAEVAAAISRFEPVTVGVSAAQYDTACALLPDTVRVVELTSDDAWMRDTGPTFVINQTDSVRGVDWQFNAYGGPDEGLYPAWDNDDRIARKVLAIERVPRYRAPLVVEGGAIHVDGEGTLITTESVLLNPNRNPGLTKSQVEAHLRDYAGAEKIIWLPEGVHADETGGHVDNLCCFVRPGVVALTWTDDEADPQYAISRHAYETLSRHTDAKGRPLEIQTIHQPPPLYISGADATGLVATPQSAPRRAGDRLAASYINFYIANGGVIAPTFDAPTDDDALNTLRHLFPDREIVGIYSREILLGGGNIHCITQQQPESSTTTTNP